MLSPCCFKIMVPLWASVGDVGKPKSVLRKIDYAWCRAPSKPTSKIKYSVYILMLCIYFSLVSFPLCKCCLPILTSQVLRGRYEEALLGVRGELRHFKQHSDWIRQCTHIGRRILGGRRRRDIYSRLFARSFHHSGTCIGAPILYYVTKKTGEKDVETI